MVSATPFPVLYHLLVLYTHLKMLILPLAMERGFTVWTNNFIVVLSRSYVKQKCYLLMNTRHEQREKYMHL